MSKSFKSVEILISIVVATAFLVACSSPISDTGGDATSSIEYHVGNTGPAGGVIVYKANDNSAGWQYLEAYPQAERDKLPDQKWWTSVSPPRMVANNSNYVIGSGLENTERIIGVLGNTESYAARTIDGLSYGGKNDWFLPSAYGLIEVIKHFYNGTTTDSPKYWSSSQYNGSGNEPLVVDYSYYSSSGTSNVSAGSRNPTLELKIWPVRRF